jgi:hypothetical protein
MYEKEGRCICTSTPFLTCGSPGFIPNIFLLISVAILTHTVRTFFLYELTVQTCPWLHAQLTRTLK